MEQDLQLDVYLRLGELEGKQGSDEAVSYLRSSFPYADDESISTALEIARKVAGLNFSDTYSQSSASEAGQIAVARMLEVAPNISSRLKGHLASEAMRSWAY